MSSEAQGIVIGAAISVPIGLLASWLFWVWITRGLAPRIKWSKHISVNDKWEGGPTKYRVKIQNVGRRAAVDFSATCMLRIPQIATGGNTKLVNLRTLDVPLPRLASGHGRVITIKTDGLSEAHVAGLPSPLRECFNQSPPIGLEEIFDRFPGAEIVLYLSAYDEVSGTRCSYRSLPYKAASLTRNWFSPRSVSIVDTPPA